MHISGQPIPVPQGAYSAYKLFTDLEASKNLVSVNYTDTSPEAKLLQKKAMQGMFLGLGSLYGGTSLITALAHWGASEIFPKLENKFPYILAGGALATLGGVITGLGLSISNTNKFKKRIQTFIFKDATVNMTNSLGILPTKTPPGLSLEG